MRKIVKVFIGAGLALTGFIGWAVWYQKKYGPKGMMCVDGYRAEDHVGEEEEIFDEEVAGDMDAAASAN